VVLLRMPQRKKPQEDNMKKIILLLAICSTSCIATQYELDKVRNETKRNSAALAVVHSAVKGHVENVHKIESGLTDIPEVEIPKRKSHLMGILNVVRKVLTFGSNVPGTTGAIATFGLMALGLGRKPEEI